MVYLRTAVSVDPKGWAKFDYVKMPEYRWGILLAPQVEDRSIPCGEHAGEKAWQEVPGEYRAMLRRLIVIQGDTEPASVEQQRFLGNTAPSLYDMRNLFQVNVEEGRHLWAMVYLLAQIFRRRRPRGGRRSAAPQLGLGGGAAHARRLQRGDAGLAVVLHVHLLHRSRRQDAAREPRAIRLRSAVAHLPLHADRGSASHVRRRDRRRPHDPAHLRGDEAGRHRGPVTTSIECARSASSTCRPSRRSSTCITRCRSTCSARRFRPTPPTPSTAGIKGRYHGDRARRRPQAGERDLSGRASSSTARFVIDRGAGADGDQHAAARRLHARRRRRRRALEQDHRDRRASSSS